jgi:hypothetical protein
MSKNSGI